MDTPAAPIPASPPAEPVNGTVRLDIDFSAVPEALTFEQVTDLVAHFTDALRAAVGPIRKVHYSVSIYGKVHCASTPDPVSWELALLYRTAKTKAKALWAAAEAEA